MSLASRRLLAVAVSALLLTVSTAWAQQNQGQQGQGRFQGRGGFFGGRGGGSDWFVLLANEKVQKDLEVVDEQKADLKKIGEETQAKTREIYTGVNFREMSEAEREKLGEKREAVASQARKKVEETLLPHQVERLKQISLQVRGTSALNDPEVAKALGITEEQKAQMDKVREETFSRPREGGQQGGDREALRQRFEEMRKQFQEKTLAVLTAEQRAKLEKMKGEKIDLDPSELRTGFGGGQGGGRRPGGNN